MFYRLWQNLEYDHISIMIQYCENSIMTSIMTFTFSDICKWRVTLVWQEMLTSSGTPDFICLPFGWQIHFAMSFLPLLAFRPLLAQYESSVLVCMVSHICWWCIFCFCLLIFQCGVFFMSVIVLVRDGNPLRTGAVGPFLVLCLVLVLRYVYAWFVVPAREGCAAFHVVYMLFVTDYVWTWIMTMEIGFVCLTSDSLTTFAPY